MTLLKRLIALTFLATSALALSSPAALARIVCNDEGACWHVHGDYGYRPEWRPAIPPWRWREGEHRHWREHQDEGRGDWRGGPGGAYLPRAAAVCAPSPPTLNQPLTPPPQPPPPPLSSR